MENDYRITKLHGTLIGDNRIPDLPAGEKTKVFSSTNGKTAWVDLPDGGIPIVEAEFSEELNSFILPTEQTTNFILHEESIGYFYMNYIGGAYSGFCPVEGTNMAYSLSGSGTMITLSTPVTLNFVRGTFASDDTITIPSEQTGPFILSLELIGNIYVETYKGSNTKYWGISYRKDSEGDKLLILNGEGTTLTAKTFPLLSGGGGASVSPCLNLLTEDLSAVRSSITEEEKVNLEKGLYNSVLFVKFSLGDKSITRVMFPQRLVGLDGEFMFSSYKAKPGAGEAGDWSFLGASTYGLSIGEKTSDGNYPITINKMNDVKGIQTINAVLTVDQATQDITIQLDVIPSGDMFILSPTQSEESGIGNVLMVRQPDGNYSGFWSISDDTVVCYVKPDGTGFAFYSPTAFLFQTMQETDGKVLTIESGVPRWLDPVSSLPAITSADVGKFLTVKSDQKTAWGSVPQGSPIEIVLDESKPYFNLGEYNKKIGVYLLSRPNNAILYEAKFDNDSATFTKILLYGSMKASAQNVDYLDVSGSLYGLNGDSTLAYIGSGIWQLKSEDNYKFLPYPYSQEASLCCSGGISGAIPSFTLYGSAIGKTSPDYIGLLPQVCKYCALRYDFKKTSSSTDTEKVTSAFFGSVSADKILTPAKITLIGIFDNGMGKAVLEKNASGIFESKTPIEYVEDVNAITYSKARYKHTVTLKTSAGAILWTQTLSNSKNTPVNTYEGLKTLFGGELLAGYGEYAQLDLRGGTEATDKVIKLDGTEATLASLGAFVYSDDCFLPK